MPTSPRTRWVLQVPFVTKPDLGLKERRTATLAGFKAELLPTASNYTNIVVRGFDSEFAARNLFGSLRTGLLAASLNANWGVRVRDEVQVLAIDTPLPGEVDVPLIYPEGKNLSRLLINVGSIQMQTDKVWSRLIAAVEFGLTSRSAAIAMNDERVKLALELYSDSHFEASDSARFLGFVTVLEVLKDRRSASEAAQDLVKQWKVQADALLNADEAASVRGSLDWLRSISISRGIASVVSRHLGHDRASEATALYIMRSKLVHDGEHLADAAEAVRQAEKITGELLAHVLTSGTL